MNNKRREFLKLTGLTGAGLFTGFITPAIVNPMLNSSREAEQLNGKRFNMSGYGAPKLETVRIFTDTE